MHGRAKDFVLIACLGIAAYFASQKFWDIKIELNNANEELAAEKSRRIKVEQLLARLGGAEGTARDSSTSFVSVRSGSIDQSELIRIFDANRARADQLLRDGDVNGAMELYRWCYENAFAKNLREKAVIRNLLSGLMGTYPQARDLLRELRDETYRKIGPTGAASEEQIAAQEFATLNTSLKEQGRTLDLWDAFPPESPSKKVMGQLVFDQLMAAGRFEEAAASKSFVAMMGEAESWSKIADQFPTGSGKAESQNRLVFNLRALVAAGRIADAQYLASRLLEGDKSPQMRDAVTNVAQQVGHPEFVK
jgi:hypothetical protein